MGILLAFMFVLNMVGALVLLPAIGLFIMRERVGQHRGRAIPNALARRYGGQTLAAGPFL